MRNQRWTDEETSTLRQMKADGKDNFTIGRALGRRMANVAERWRYINMTPEQAASRRGRINAARNGGVTLPKRPGWTEAEKSLLLEMRDVQKKSWSDISKAIAKPSGTVYSIYYYIKNCSTPPRESALKVEIPKRNVEEWHRRQQLSPRDLTSALMGDPLPGYSALERRA